MLKNISNISFKVEASGLLNKALKTLERRKFDAILLDLNLPDSVGIETASKTLEVVRDTPIIILAGLNEESLAISTVKMGIQDYLVKAQLNSILLIRAIQYAIERKKTEQKLKESEKKYKDLFKQCPMAILLINFEGIIEDCNSSTEVLFGYAKKELLGIDFLKFDKIPLDTKLILAKSFSKFLKTGLPELSEIQMYRKDGKMIWINSHPINVTIDEKSYILVLIQDITERKKVEKELLLERDNFLNILNSMEDGVYIVDQNYNIEYVNPILIKEFGRYEGKKCYDYFEDREEVCPWCKNQEVFKGETVRREWYSAKNQKTYDLIDTPLKNADGSVSKLEIFRDITERKKKEEKIRLQSEIIENMSEGVYLIKLDNGTIVYTNPAFEEMFGYNPGEMIGKNVAIVNAPTDKTPEEIREEIMGDLLENGEWHGEVLNIKKDGTSFWCYANVSLFDHPEYGRVIVSVHTDITERKKTEVKLKESEAKHRGLLETAVMGLIEIDILLNKISYINPKLLEIVGYTREELKDNSIFYKLIHPEDLEELFTSNGDRDVEFRIYSKEGKLKWLSGTRKYTISEKGELINVRLWLQDITESKEIEEIKSSLLTRFSHEFKTPLISIKGFADFLLTEYKVNLDEKMLSFLRRIKEGSNRLEALINLFMESSHLEKAIIRVNLKQEDVSDLIQEVLQELEGFIGMRKHIINVSLDEKLITNIDKEKIYTVISNILINAINCTPQGGKISIKSSMDKNFLTISMKDNGIGLTEEEKNLLFKPFGKIERYGKGWDITAGGMGMGLYISKEIIELHGGKIWAESEGRSKGSEFYFSLPIK